MRLNNIVNTKGRLFTISTIIMLTFIISACDANKGDEKKKEDEEKKEVAIPVETSLATLGSITAFYPATTTFESEQEASVVAKVSGIVEKFFVEEGDTVEAGQAMVQLETDRLKLELKRSEANLNKLKNDLKRTRAIYKKNLVSSETFEKLKFEYDSQQASYELSKLELTFATVVAPISGVVSLRHIKVGNMVNINEAVYHITDFDPLHAIIYIPEKELYKIKPNQQALIQVDASTDKIYKGFVKRISPIVDADSGTFKVTVEITDSEGHLKPGMFGRLQIIYDVHEQALLIDKKALINEDSQSSVFVMRDNHGFKTMVTTGYVADKKIEILSGIKEGDVIIITGQNSLKDNSLVEVLNQDSDTKTETTEPTTTEDGE